MAGQEAEERPSIFDPESSAGLFVGISTFEDVRFQQVPYAVDDAVDLAHLFVVELGLVRPEKAVLSLAGEPQKPQSANKLARLMELGVLKKGARHSDIYEFLSELTAMSGSQGLVLLTVATHGVSDQGADVLVASDSRRNHMVRTGVAVSDLFNEVAGARAERRLVLLDACRERLTQETRGLEGSPMTLSFADAIAQAKGSVILSGSTLGGFAYDDISRRNGVFTAAILDGLAGQAPADRDGWITVRTLADYVQQRVVAWVQRHRPDHASKSLGIGRQIESTADSLPLALHPHVLADRRRYCSRRAAALEKVARNQGRILTGALWDQIAGRLPIESPGPDSDKLLDEIEALDGTERSQRSLRDFLREDTAPPVLPAPPPASVSLPPPVSTPSPRPLSIEAVPSNPEQTHRREEAQARPTPPSKEIPTNQRAHSLYKFNKPIGKSYWSQFGITILAIGAGASLVIGIALFLDAHPHLAPPPTVTVPKNSSAAAAIQKPIPAPAPVQAAAQAPVPVQPAAPAPVPVANPRVALDTDKGRIVIELDRVAAPKTVQTFVSDVVAGKYNNIYFIGRMAGMLYGQSAGHWDGDDISSVPRNKVGRGTVVMERNGNPGNIFLEIQLGDISEFAPSVPFGKVVLGMDVIDAIADYVSDKKHNDQIIWIRKAMLLASTVPKRLPPRARRPRPLRGA